MRQCYTYMYYFNFLNRNLIQIIDFVPMSAFSYVAGCVNIDGDFAGSSADLESK